MSLGLGSQGPERSAQLDGSVVKKDFQRPPGGITNNTRTFFRAGVSAALLQLPEFLLVFQVKEPIVKLELKRPNQGRLTG